MNYMNLGRPAGVPLRAIPLPDKLDVYPNAAQFLARKINESTYILYNIKQQINTKQYVLFLK